MKKYLPYTMGLVLGILLSCFLVAGVVSGQGDNLNSRFGGSSPTFTTVTATTGTFSAGYFTTMYKGGVAISATAAQLNYLYGVTPGTTTASKALVAGSSGELNALTVTALTIGTRTAVVGYYKGIQTAGGPDSVAVAGLDSNDYVFGTITRKAAADSSITLLYVIPASPTAGKAYLKFSATPSDTIGVNLLTLQD